MLDIEDLLKAEDLYQIEFPGGWKFTWKLLSIKEYRVFSALRDSGTIHPFLIYRKVFDRCYLGDPNLLNSRLPMFIPITIGQLIMYLSGDTNWDTLKDDIEMLRSSYAATEVYEVIKRVILTAYPTYDPNDLEGITRPELLRRFVSAEAMLSYKTSGQYNPVDFSPAKQIEQQIETIDFNKENQAIMKNLHPFDEEEFFEDQFEKKKKVVNLTPKQIEQLNKKARR